MLCARSPGIANLDVLLVKLREAGLHVDLQVVGEPHPLPPGVDLSAFRIVQEALDEHAQVRRAGARPSVCVGSPDALELEVADDGRGAPSTGPESGHGLVGMSERVALFGGVARGRATAGGRISGARPAPLDDGA